MKIALVASCLVVYAASLAAQAARPRFTFDATGAYGRLRDQVGDSSTTLSGAIFAGEGRMIVGRWVVAAGYLDGQLSGGGATRNLVEGRFSVGASPWPWLTVTAGPLIRAYVSDSETERWVLWQLRARAHGPSVVPTLAPYVELWRAVSATVNNLPDPVDRVQGGEAGMVFQPPRGSWWIRLAYRIDDASLGNASHRETVEAISIAVGMGTR